MSHLLTISDLTIAFTGDTGTHEVTDHLSLTLDEGEIVCLVGESGCGKSVTSMSLLGLLGPGGSVKEGSICYEDRDLLTLSEKELDQIRGKEISMIFQDPMSSLNPTFTIGYQIMEGLRIHLGLKKREAWVRAVELLARVGMKEPELVMKSYPHTLSGGMRQRAIIAMALACDPKLLIADEPTTALDVSVQAQIMELLKRLQKEFRMAVLLITHDMGVVSHMADRVLVMYAGQIVEEAQAEELFHHPSHPYTRALLSAIPTTRDSEDRKLSSIPGMVPENYDTISGCRFADRCPYTRQECHQRIGLREISKEHTVRCILQL
ncbi:MAG TPA: peptide ABC transporter ATP-binding protein [Lachnospiraceae bacterium]|nr:peptide ABC transporter ATP-binding protein [Lachnospiraceae bacterium]